MTLKRIEIPLNRVEGDLEIHLELEDGRVSDAWAVGSMYRGFENILMGRAPLDGLVITPRICGICSTSHLKAASKALDMVFNAAVPDNAKRVRNAAMMVEKIQNDVRHAFLLFNTDFTRDVYQKFPQYQEAMRRYASLRGETTVQTISESKRILEIIAILGGQWPHSSFMVPGGVLSACGPNDLMQCRHLLNAFRNWYENRVLGCSLERWLEIETGSELDAWLDESDDHLNSDLGFFIRFSKMAGLDKIGRGYGHFISFGAFDMPEYSVVKNPNQEHLFPPGFAIKTRVQALHQEKIAEDVSFSWFEGYEGMRHPFGGLTNPMDAEREENKYSWCKAPRYNALPAETGPLAEMIVAGNPLFVDLVETFGPSVYIRQLARIVRSTQLIPVLDQWLAEMAVNQDDFYTNYERKIYGQGFGLINAPRGALGHWVKIKNAKIEKYQIVTPTAWNASPRDSNGRRGPCEEALIGTEIMDMDHPVEVEHVIRSFDPCLVCTVHTIDIK